MKAEILSVGDELLIGQTVNNNAAFMGRLLAEINVDVQWLTAVGDQIDRIVSAIETAWNRTDIVLMTGGLGPTHDDITKDALCRFFGVEYTFHDEIFQEIQTRFANRGMDMPEIVRNQGLIPTGADLIRNELGSAFGIRFQRDNHVLIAMPGVPFEMERMMRDSVIPFIQTLTGSFTILIRKVKTAGIIESKLVTEFKRLSEVLKLAEVAVLPKLTGVELRLTVRGNDPVMAARKMDQALAMTLEAVRPWIVTLGDETIEDVIGMELSRAGLTVATAESCTGGLLADRLTSVPGSSAYFVGGVVSYSNEIKRNFLDVPDELLETYGAVSAEVAEAMAASVRRKMKTYFGVSTTGIAGPKGGSETKPVGLAYIAVASLEEVWTDKVIFNVDRHMNKQRFAQTALNLLRRAILEKMKNGSVD